MKKFCKRLYIYRYSICFFTILFLASICFPSKETSDPEVVEIDWNFYKYNFIIAAVILLLLLGYFILLYKKSGYSINENDVSVQSGVFFKHKSILTYDRMNAINKRQSIIQRIFGIQGLYIDSGSTNTVFQSEIKIYGTPKNVDEILKEIESRRKKEIHSSEIEEGNGKLIFQYSKKDKLLFGLMSTVASTIILLLFLGVVILGFYVLTYTLPLDFIFGVLITFAAICILSFVISIGIAFIGYYDFKLLKADSELLIDYGILAKHNHKLPIEKIKAIRIHQGIIQKIFGFASLKIDVVGYVTSSNSNNGNSSQIGVLIPFCRIEEVSNYIEQMHLDYIPSECSNTSKKLFPHISVGLLVMQIFTAFILFLLVLLYFEFEEYTLYYLCISIGLSLGVDAFVCLLLWGCGYLSMKHCMIQVDEHKLTVCSGSLLKKTVVIHRENVIAIEDVTTHLRSRKNLYSYLIHVHSNALHNVIKVDILDKEVRVQLLDFLQNKKS